MVYKTCPHASHDTGKMSTEASNYPFLLFTKLNHVRLTSMVKVFLLYEPTRLTRAFKGLISPPSEPPGEIMSFGVSPVNYSDSDSDSWENQQCGFRTGPTQTELYKPQKQARSFWI